MRTRATLDELLARPGRVLGSWSQIASPDLVETLGRAGFAFTIIDCEHGAFGIETAAALIRAADAAAIAPLVRIPRGDAVMAGKALDAGAVGVLAPGVESAAEAQALCAATRFAPGGSRGACPIVRAAGHSLQPWDAFVAQQDGNGLLVMLETAAAIEQCEAIVAVEGIKAVVAGPFDLSVSCGLEGDYRHPRVQAALERVLGAAMAHAVPLVMPVFAPDEPTLRELVGYWSARGVRHFAVGADKIFFAQAAARFRAWAS